MCLKVGPVIASMLHAYLDGGFVVAGFCDAWFRQVPGTGGLVQCHGEPTNIPGHKE